jgi:hypothetical protein
LIKNIYEIMDLEEKEYADEEEVMDVGGDNFVIPPKHVKRNWNSKKKGKPADQKTVK